MLQLGRSVCATAIGRGKSIALVSHFSSRIARAAAQAVVRAGVV